eukprot:snap_masked-scaffold_21-processed-gene-1.25-mRNA-1 protein AED:1.00 eAED:1.00 QI:0/0/0/0/1/1/2/0/70
MSYTRFIVTAEIYLVAFSQKNSLFYDLIWFVLLHLDNGDFHRISFIRQLPRLEENNTFHWNAIFLKLILK